MEDLHIIELLFNRADSAIDALSHKYGKLLHTIAANILEDLRDVQECVNDTYLALWNTIPPQKPDPLSAYACRIVRNTALKRHRSNTAQMRNSAYDLSLEELAGCIPDSCLEDTLAARELGQAINAFLGTLNQENRMIFLRRYWFGDSVKAIAALFGKKESAVSVGLSRTRAALAHYLNKEGYL